MTHTAIEMLKNMNDYDMEAAIKTIKDSLEWLDRETTIALERVNSVSEFDPFEIVYAAETVVQHDMFRRITEATTQIRQLEKNRKILDRVMESQLSS